MSDEESDYSLNEDGVRPEALEFVTDNNGEAADADASESKEETPKDDEMDDNEELVEMRGEGRYFGTGDEILGPVCRNCHGRGHMARNCDTVICDVCGVHDDHYSRQCPTARKCSNCGQPGHLRNECKNKSKYIFCSRCESRAHTEQFCPLIWRSYRTTKGKAKYPAVISCYDCGLRGHYGDDCPTSRSASLRFVEKSAFNGENLARPMRQKYRVESKAYGKKSSSSGSSAGSRFSAKISKYTDRAKNVFKGKKDKRSKPPSGPRWRQ